MKTKPHVLIASCLLFAACGEKAGPSSEDAAGNGPPADTRGRFPLTTELPPELIEGTPRPIVLPSRTPLPRHRPLPLAPQVRAELPPRTPPALPPRPLEEARAGFPVPRLQPPPVDRERYAQFADNPWQTPVDAPLSTFSIDVDTAAYANLRRMAMEGRRVPADAIRLEELVNYFDYDYPQPDDGHPFAVRVDNAACPWNTERQLVRVALKGLETSRDERPPANLVFLLDVSGSMNDPNKLPLVAASLELLLEELNPSDSLAIVVYAGAEGLVLPPTACDAAGRHFAATALRHLRASGSTNGGAGIGLAYRIAREQFKPGGINRVVLATDGDFNVGVTDDGDLVRMVVENAARQVDLTVLGVGAGNLNDAMLEAITNKGNGNYHYLDSLAEARRVFLQKLTGNLLTIARDVKIQVEFNPARVRGYRLLGYANRLLRKEEFADDRVDAGDIGAGHTVTAFYEIEPGDGRALPPAVALRYAMNGTAGPAGDPDGEWSAESAEWLTVKLRYRRPEGGPSTLLERPFIGIPRDFAAADADFRFAAAVAMSAMVLRGEDGSGQGTLESARAIAAASLGPDPRGERAGFVDLLRHFDTLR